MEAHESVEGVPESVWKKVQAVKQGGGGLNELKEKVKTGGVGEASMVAFVVWDFGVDRSFLLFQDGMEAPRTKKSVYLLFPFLAVSRRFRLAPTFTRIFQESYIDIYSTQSR